MNSLTGASSRLASPIYSMQAITPKNLPKQIIADGQWIVSDMDGTLIEAPAYRKEPTLGESSAKEAIFNWLRAGGHLLVLTGCETKRTVERFANYIPKDIENALIERRLLLGTNGGATLSYYDGSQWTEDSNYQNTAIQTRIAISKENETLLLKNAVTVINDFNRKLREDESLIPEFLRTKYKAIAEIARSKHAYDFTLEELETLNSDVIPRIEVRRAATNEVVQISIMGIPSDINYDVSKLDLEKIGNFSLCKVGVTHEINLKNIDKALPIRWLQKGQADYPELINEKSLAIGDRPNHNDAPLITAVGAFVSVCEHDHENYIPKNVRFKIGHNENGTSELLKGLLEKALELHKDKRLEPLIVEKTLKKVVKAAANTLNNLS